MSKRNFYVSDIDVNLKLRKEEVTSKLESDFSYKSNYLGNLLNMEWLERIEKTCPNIDTIVRRAKIALIKETEVVRMEKSKKITVESIKDLARHSNYIDKYDPETNEIMPRKILNVRSEETYDIYENRFLYTLIDCMDKFIYDREQELMDLTLNDERKLVYKAKTEYASEKITIDLRINSVITNTDDIDKKIKEELKLLFKRIKRVKEYISSWKKSEMFLVIDKLNTKIIKPPIKKTNVILKNPNFQVAVVLWDYLRTYGLEDESAIRDNVKNERNELIKFVDETFIKNYCVLDSLSKMKSNQKFAMADYSVLLLLDQIESTLELLKNCGYDVTEEQLFTLLSNARKEKKNNRLVGSDDIKKKFKTAIDEYLERTNDYL